MKTFKQFLNEEKTHHQRLADLRKHGIRIVSANSHRHPHYSWSVEFEGGPRRTVQVRTNRGADQGNSKSQCGSEAKERAVKIMHDEVFGEKK